MGVVVAAHHLQLDERVALKFLLPDAVRSVEAISRFVREARAAAKIKSEHVARVTDVGQLENGSPYMVMEYLEGGDLAGRLEEKGPMPIPEAVDFVLQTCEALADAHSLGIVHRDLKPANLFCIERSDGQLSIKVLDFGISKITTPGAPGHDMTLTNAVMGSPPYMSPEQMKQSKGVDARADIWSLGVILFELLTGRVPFDSEVVTDLAIKVASEPPPLLRELRPEAPAGLEQVIATCLQKDCERRFQSVGELAIALKDYAPRSARISIERVLGTLRKAGMSGAVLAPSEEVAADPALAATHARRAQQPHTATAWGATGARTKSRRVAFGIGAAIALGGVAVALGWGARERTAPAAVESSSATASPSGAELLATAARALPADAEPVLPAVDVSTLPIATLPSTPSAVAARPPVRPAHSAVAAPSGAPPNPATLRPPASKSACNPAYVIDSAGHRQYKPECLN